MNIKVVVSCPAEAMQHQFASDTLAAHADRYECSGKIDVVIIDVAVFQHGILIILELDDEALLISLVFDQFDDNDLR